MGAQCGVLSAFQLGIHDHLTNERGGILNAYSRYGAYRRPYRTGALAVNFPNDAVRSTANGAYTELKRTLVNATQAGEVVFSFDMRGTDGVTFNSSRVRVNGVNIGVLHNSNSNVWVTYTDTYDLGLIAGDLLQVWALSAGGADTVSIRNFRIYYDWHLPGFGDGTVNNLTAPLALTDVDLLDLTAVAGY